MQQRGRLRTDQGDGMDIGIIGSGQIGSILARRLAAVGHQIRIANSRGPESLATLAAETGATPSTVEQAASARDVVIVTIPQKAVRELPRGLFAKSTAIVVDTGNYYPARDGRIDAIDEGLTDSEWVAQVLGRPVVKAFNNIVAESLGSRGVPHGTPGRVCLSVAGDDAAAKRMVLRLLDEVGFDGLDAGSLAESWRQQPGSPAYCKDLDRTALQAALSKPDAAGISSRRQAADEQVRAFFEAHPADPRNPRST
ncbi:MAG: NADPH-dependent F420 reductase [Myxococcales bacterium]